MSRFGRQMQAMASFNLRRPVPPPNVPKKPIQGKYGKIYIDPDDPTHVYYESYRDLFMAMKQRWYNKKVRKEILRRSLIITLTSTGFVIAFYQLNKWVSPHHGGLLIFRQKVNQKSTNKAISKELNNPSNDGTDSGWFNNTFGANNPVMMNIQDRKNFASQSQYKSWEFSY